MMNVNNMSDIFAVLYSIVNLQDIMLDGEPLFVSKLPEVKSNSNHPVADFINPNHQAKVVSALNSDSIPSCQGVLDLRGMFSMPGLAVHETSIVGIKLGQIESNSYSKYLPTNPTIYDMLMARMRAYSTNVNAPWVLLDAIKIPLREDQVGKKHDDVVRNGMCKRGWINPQPKSQQEGIMREGAATTLKDYAEHRNEEIKKYTSTAPYITPGEPKTLRPLSQEPLCEQVVHQHRLDPDKPRSKSLLAAEMGTGKCVITLEAEKRLRSTSDDPVIMCVVSYLKDVGTGWEEDLAQYGRSVKFVNATDYECPEDEALKQWRNGFDVVFFTTPTTASNIAKRKTRKATKEFFNNVSAVISDEAHNTAHWQEIVKQSDYSSTFEDFIDAFPEDHNLRIHYLTGTPSKEFKNSFPSPAIWTREDQITAHKADPQNERSIPVQKFYISDIDHTSITAADLASYSANQVNFLDNDQLTSDERAEVFKKIIAYKEKPQLTALQTGSADKTPRGFIDVVMPNKNDDGTYPFGGFMVWCETQKHTARLTSAVNDHIPGVKMLNISTTENKLNVQDIRKFAKDCHANGVVPMIASVDRAAVGVSINELNGNIFLYVNKTAAPFLQKLARPERSYPGKTETHTLLTCPNGVVTLYRECINEWYEPLKSNKSQNTNHVMSEHIFVHMFTKDNGYKPIDPETNNKLASGAALLQNKLSHWKEAGKRQISTDFWDIIREISSDNLRALIASANGKNGKEIEMRIGKKLGKLNENKAKKRVSQNNNKQPAQNKEEKKILEKLCHQVSRGITTSMTLAAEQGSLENIVYGSGCCVENLLASVYNTLTKDGNDLFTSILNDSQTLREGLIKYVKKTALEMSDTEGLEITQRLNSADAANLITGTTDQEPIPIDHLRDIYNTVDNPHTKTCVVAHDTLGHGYFTAKEMFADVKVHDPNESNVKLLKARQVPDSDISTKFDRISTMDKIDFFVTNPPFNDGTGGKTPIYHKFLEDAAAAGNIEYAVCIIPTNWFSQPQNSFGKSVRASLKTLGVYKIRMNPADLFDGVQVITCNCYCKKGYTGKIKLYNEDETKFIDIDNFDEYILCAFDPIVYQLLQRLKPTDPYTLYKGNNTKKGDPSKYRVATSYRHIRPSHEIPMNRIIVIEPNYKSQGGYQVLAEFSTKEEADTARNYYASYWRSKLVWSILAKTRVSYTLDNPQIAWVPRLPAGQEFDKVFTDEEIYSMHNLTAEEIAVVEADVEKYSEIRADYVEQNS